MRSSSAAKPNLEFIEHTEQFCIGLNVRRLELLDPHPTVQLTRVNIRLQVIKKQSFTSFASWNERQVLGRPTPRHVLQLLKPCRHSAFGRERRSDGSKPLLAHCREHDEPLEQPVAPLEEVLEMGPRKRMRPVKAS